MSKVLYSFGREDQLDTAGIPALDLPEPRRVYEATPANP